MRFMDTLHTRACGFHPLRPPAVNRARLRTASCLPVSQFTPAQLFTALAATRQEVKVFSFLGDFIRVPAVTALAILRTDPSAYEGGGTVRRCRYIRAVKAPDPRISVNWRPADANLGQTFISYPQSGTALNPR